jgi:uncharacterized protein YjiS (DUF1127 family)
MHAPPSTTTRSAGRGIAGASHIAGSVSRAGRRLLSWMSQGRHRRRTAELLSEASDSTLEDIGFSRAEVATIAEHGLDPARRPD